MADICHECENPAWTGRTIEAPALPSGGEGGTSNFNALDNRPKYDGERMTGNTNIPNTARDVERLDGDITDIQELIPETATPENQLADKDFVNSSVATNTANFVGTFNSLEELEAVENPSNNDYGFVISTDEYGNTVYNRYKYVASVENWEFEYALNNSSFTAAQWATINSGLTSGDATKVRSLAEIISVGTGLQLDANGNLAAKLYNETGDNTDAPMNQKAASDALTEIWGTAKEVSIETTPEYYDTLSIQGQTYYFLQPWKMPAGLYVQKDGGSKVGGNTNSSAFKFLLVGPKVGSGNTQSRIMMYSYQDVSQRDKRLVIGLLEGNGSSFGSQRSLLGSEDIKNNLTSTSTTTPLSAAQGKALAEMIGTLSNLNTTAKTNTVAAINEVAGYKGQARVLTEADYNWNTTTNTTTGELNAVALWLLPPGFYVWGRDSSSEPRIMANVDEQLSGYGLLGALVLSQSSNLNHVGILAIGQGSNAAAYFSTNVYNGAQSVRTFLLTQASVINTLSSTSADSPLSANQGRILKGLIDGKQDKLTAGNGIEIDNQNVISIATISTEDWSALWQ